MVKKILIVVGVAVFSFFWWLGFEKIKEMSPKETSYGCEAQGFMGK